jgi:hypothetical protein
MPVMDLVARLSVGERRVKSGSMIWLVHVPLVLISDANEIFRISCKPASETGNEGLSRVEQ